MPTQIQLRRDTAADWTSNNPTMAAGEFGWESDTNRFKIGDGSTAWQSLAYADTLKTLGDIAVTGSTISAPSNGDLTLTTSGSGKVNAPIMVIARKIKTSAVARSSTTALTLARNRPSQEKIVVNAFT